jgi:two-component system response regulator AtoC
MNNVARILFIDDEPGNRESLTLLLEREGYRVDAVDAGEKAMDLLARESYGVIITDLFLPGVSGIDITLKSTLCPVTSFSSPATPRPKRRSKR